MFCWLCFVEHNVVHSDMSVILDEYSTTMKRNCLHQWTQMIRKKDQQQWNVMVFMHQWTQMIHNKDIVSDWNICLIIVEWKHPPTIKKSGRAKLFSGSFKSLNWSHSLIHWVCWNDQNLIILLIWLGHFHISITTHISYIMYKTNVSYKGEPIWKYILNRWGHCNSFINWSFSCKMTVYVRILQHL